MIGEPYEKKISSKRISLKKYLIMVSMIAVSIVLFFVGLVFYTRTIRYIDEKLDLMEKNRFYRLYSDIDESINSINRVIEYLQNSEILLSYLNTAENEKDNIYRQGVAINNISKLLTNALLLNRYLLLLIKVNTAIIVLKCSTSRLLKKYVIVNLRI